MGTRSVTFVEENYDGEKALLVAMYRQMDGYPTGMGADLKEFLDGASLCNGISLGEDNSNSHNGLGCLAASLVGHFKTGIGSIYLQNPSSDLAWIDYVYTIYSDDDVNIKLKVENPHNVIYDGLVSDFDPEKVEQEE